MIVVKLMGGLGNQLFQYAFGISLSNKLNSDVAYDISSFINDSVRKLRLNSLGLSLKYKNRSCIFVILMKLARYCSGRSRLVRSFNLLKRIESAYEMKTAFFYKIIKEADFNIGTIPQTKNYYFDGYWQNPAYFEDVRPIILKNINFPDLQNAQDLNLRNLIINSESVAIHIRRGDYVENRQYNDFYGTCSPEYYRKAIDRILSGISNAKFFLFTDDPDFVEANFDFLPTKTLVSDKQRSEIDDLNLMHLCKHFIIANSSFSWWGAWLSQNPQKIVVAPKQWYKNEEANEQCKIVPKDWIKI